MKHAKATLPFLLVIVFLALLLAGCQCGGGKTSTSKREMSMNGPMYGNEWSFVDETENELHFTKDENSVLSTAYFKAISYEVKSSDEESMTAVVEFKVPLLSRPFETAIDEIDAGRFEEDYEAYFNAVGKKIADILGSNDVEYNTFAIVLQLKRINGKLRMCINDELSELIGGNIEKTLLEGYDKIMEDIENGDI